MVMILQTALSLVEPFRQKSNSPPKWMSGLALDSPFFQQWRWTKFFLIIFFSQFYNVIAHKKCEGDQDGDDDTNLRQLHVGCKAPTKPQNKSYLTP